MNSIEYKCIACNYITKSKSKINIHVKTDKHKESMKEDKPYKCYYCNNYKGSYDKWNLYQHVKKYHPNEGYSNLSIIQCKKRINKLLAYFKKNNIDPNDYINYYYYASNIKTLDKQSYNDFLIDLLFVKNLFNS